MQGDTVHARAMQTPFPALVKKLNINHFATRNGSQTDPRTSQSFSTDAEKFDPTGAANLMQSKHTASKQNSLFQDTRMFNMSSVEYNSMLSQPGALEALDKDYDSMQRKAGRTMAQDFQSIRATQKLSSDISLMSPFKSVKGKASGLNTS